MFQRTAFSCLHLHCDWGCCLNNFLPPWIVFNHFPSEVCKAFSSVREEASRKALCQRCSERCRTDTDTAIWEMFWDFLGSSAIKGLPYTAVKGFTSVLASFGFLGASLLPTSSFAATNCNFFPPKGINMHVIVTLSFPLLANHLSVSKYF